MSTNSCKARCVYREFGAQRHHLRYQVYGATRYSDSVRLFVSCNLWPRGVSVCRLQLSESTRAETGKER